MKKLILFISIFSISILAFCSPVIDNDLHPNAKTKSSLDEMKPMVLANLASPKTLNQSVLIISDGVTETDVASVLTNAGCTVTTIGLDYTYHGTPAPSDFNVVILLDGAGYDDGMPTDGQLAIKDYVSNGGGFILTEWISYEVGEGRYQSMLDLILTDRSGGGSGSDSYSLVGTHPVTDGVSSFSVSHGYSESSANSGTVVLHGTNAGDAVVVKEYGNGKIVHFASAGNYNSYHPFLNANMQQLLINAVEWTSGNTLNSPFNLTASFDQNTETTTLNWEFDNSKEFLTFNVYRNSILIGTAADTTFTDLSVAYGEYDYQVTALYDDGESNYSNTASINYTNISVSPSNLDFGIVEVGESASLDITINNTGDATFGGLITTPVGFEVDYAKNSLGYSVPPNSSSTFTISFSPTASQVYDGDIVITHNTYGPDQIVTVTGEGILIFDLPYLESFETSFAGWEQSPDADIDWTRNSGSTGSSSTGPSSAYDGNYYLYTEASSGGNPYKTFGLEANFDCENIVQPYLEFYYHMYGSSMGELKVQASIDAGENWTDLWSIAGNQGNNWIHKEIDLITFANEETLSIRFWGTSGNDYSSDMAIDFIEVYNHLDAPTNLAADLNSLLGITTLNWDFPTSKAFQNFTIYRDDMFIGTSTDTIYSDTLTAFGNFEYKVTAIHDEGESKPSNTVTVNHFSTTPNNLTANLEQNTGIVSLDWDFDQSKAFQLFNVYRDDVIIGTSSDSTYADTLLTYETYDYKVSALYEEGESGFSNIETILYTNISVAPTTLDYGILAVGGDSIQLFTITNSGNASLSGGITTPIGFEVEAGKNTLTYTVAPMTTDTFKLHFIPTNAQTYSGDLIITHNTAGPDKTISVSGTGVLIFTLPYSESFETDFAGWEQTSNDDQDWARNSGQTGSSSTGPSSAYDGNYYLYTEASGSGTGYPYKTFGLSGSFNFENVGKPMLTFWYNMYGSTMGTLTVQVSTDAGSNWTDVWGISGNQGNTWQQTDIDLSLYGGEELVLIRYWGVTGNNYYSDMAIDFIEVYDHLDAPTNLAADLNSLLGITTLNWDFPTSKAFQNFTIYRDDMFIGTSTDTIYSDTLTAFGNFEYKVTAIHDEGESKPSNTVTVNHFSTTPNNLTANLEQNTGIVSLDWDFDQSKAFQLFNVYRDDVIIGTSSDSTYADTLLTYETYDYKVSALYEEGESGFSNIETILYTNISVAPTTLDYGILAVGGDSIQLFTITNSGNASLSGGITTPIGFEVEAGKNTLTYTVAPMTTDTFKLHFIPTNAQTYSGDLIITHNTAGPDKTISVSGTGVLIFTLPYSESFETDFAGWEQTSNDDQDWARNSGQTGSSSTGPSSAYDGNYYLYTEASGSGTGYPYKTFGLSGSFNFENVGKPMLTFWYNMYGSTMGTLTVQVSTDAGSNWTDVWGISGNQGNTWQQTDIDLSLYGGEELVLIRYWGVTGNNYYSDMAIDLIELYNDLDEPFNLTSSLNPLSGEVNLNWELETSKAFLNFNIYRDNVMVGTSNDTLYSEILPSYGSYDYYVTALYTDGESDPTNTETVFWEYTNFSATPNVLSAELASGDSTVQLLTISDLGGLGLDYNLQIDYTSKTSSTPKLSIQEVENSILKASNILNQDITKTSFCISEDKVITTTFTKPEDIIYTVYSNSKSNLSIGVLGAESSTSYLVDVQNKLISTGKFGSVTYINVGNVTPTLAELQAFDAVIVWTDADFDNTSLLGDRMADYVDGGGGVVNAMFEVSNYSSTHYLQGRWFTDGYYILTKGSFSTSVSYLGTIVDPTHPIMQNINTFTGKFRPSTTTIPTNANLIARWSDGKTLVITDETFAQNRVELGMWPVSNSVATGGWTSGTDGALLMANALEWVTESAGWLSVNPESGTIAGNSSADIDVKFNASGLVPGTYQANITVSNTAKAQIIVPVTLTVLHPISLDLTAFLEGPFFGGQMNTLLNIFGFIPLSQPYSVSPWNYSGTENVGVIPNNDVVDWVLVEVRETAGDASTATAATTIGKRAGFLLKDGSIVDLDGISPLVFSAIATQNIFAVVYHRNHLPILSAYPLSATGYLYNFNFTNGESQVYGGSAGHKELSSGIWGMFSGNALPDAQIDNKDKNDVWEIEKGSLGYYNGDLDMDRQVDASDKQVNWESNVGKASNVPE